MTYNPDDKPFTDYPAKLTAYLISRYELDQEEYCLLDVGCGRGEYTEGFWRANIAVYGIDKSDFAKEKFPLIGHRAGDFMEYEFEGLFNVIFNKSFLEHLYYPEQAVEKVYNLLVPNGRIITMVPEYNKHFWGSDITHRHPFTAHTLKQLHVWCGFDEVEVERFIPSPPLWERPWLTPIFRGLARLGFKHPDIRYSLANMLLCTGRKMK